MRAISGCCLPSLERRTARGFTLLELLVVMALVALTVGLVAPAARRSIDGAKERGVASDVSAILASLPARAFQRGQAMTVDAPTLRRLVAGLPQDWELGVPEPLHYSATGVASGGMVRLRPPGQATLAWRVRPLSGEVERTRDGPHQ